MSEIKTIVDKKTSKKDIISTIEYVEITDDIVVYRKTTNETETSDGEIIKNNKTVKEGITTLDNLNSLSSIGDISDDIKMGTTYGLFISEHTEMIKKFGRSSYNVIPHRNQLISKTPFTDWTNTSQNFTTNNVIGFNFPNNDIHQSYTVDVFGNKKPNSIMFEYIYAKMANVLYDLEKVIDVLYDRDDILFFDLENNNRTIDKTTAVLDIPSYNISGSKDKYVSFLWAPTIEQFKYIFDNIETSDQMNIHKFIFDHDMLGLRKSGAVRYPDTVGFYEEYRIANGIIKNILPS